MPEESQKAVWVPSAISAAGLLAEAGDAGATGSGSAADADGSPPAEVLLPGDLAGRDPGIQRM
jgi:hypothetical protein